MTGPEPPDPEPVASEAVGRAGLDYAGLRERGILADAPARAHGQARV